MLAAARRFEEADLELLRRRFHSQLADGDPLGVAFVRPVTRKTDFTLKLLDVGRMAGRKMDLLRRSLGVAGSKRVLGLYNLPENVSSLAHVFREQASNSL